MWTLIANIIESLCHAASRREVEATIDRTVRLVVIDSGLVFLCKTFLQHYNLAKFNHMSEFQSCPGQLATFL